MEAIAALTAVLSVGVAIWALIVSNGRAREAIDATMSTTRTTMQATLLKDFKAEFDGLARARHIASSHALTRIEADGVAAVALDDVPAEVWQVMDFFDKLAMYLKRGYLDGEMVFISFLYWMLPYWLCFQEDVAAMQDVAPLAMWHEIPRQLKELEGLAPRLDVTPESIEKSKAWVEVREFMKREAAECLSAVTPLARS
jgi:hypothetical protein